MKEVTMRTHTTEDDLSSVSQQAPVLQDKPEFISEQFSQQDNSVQDQPTSLKERAIIQIGHKLSQCSDLAEGQRVIEVEVDALIKETVTGVLSKTNKKFQDKVNELSKENKILKIGIRKMNEMQDQHKVNNSQNHLLKLELNKKQAEVDELKSYINGNIEGLPLVQ